MTVPVGSVIRLIISLFKWIVCQVYRCLYAAGIWKGRIYDPPSTVFGRTAVWEKKSTALMITVLLSSIDSALNNADCRPYFVS